MAEFQPYFSEIRYRGTSSTDFMEVALDNGADPSTVSVVVYNTNGTVRSTNSLDATPDATIAGTDVYTVEAGIHQNGAIALVVNGVVVSFVSFNKAVTASEGPANGLTSTQIGTTNNSESLVSNDMGSTYSVETSPNPGTIPCFLGGTLIETAYGERPVEGLEIGDLVRTAEGVKPLVWIGSRRIKACAEEKPEFAPILLPRGSLGMGRPSRDLRVSPSHRVLVADPYLELLFEAPEVLIPARHLVGWNGIRVALEVARPVYFHLMFDCHELVWSNGTLTESFHPALPALSSFQGEVRRELFSLFPELRKHPELYGPTTRRCLKSFESEVALSAIAGMAKIQASQAKSFAVYPSVCPELRGQDERDRADHPGCANDPPNARDNWRRAYKSRRPDARCASRHVDRQRNARTAGEDACGADMAMDLRKGRP